MKLSTPFASKSMVLRRSGCRGWMRCVSSSEYVCCSRGLTISHKRPRYKKFVLFRVKCSVFVQTPNPGCSKIKITNLFPWNHGILGPSACRGSIRLVKLVSTLLARASQLSPKAKKRQKTSKNIKKPQILYIFPIYSL